MGARGGGAGDSASGPADGVAATLKFASGRAERIEILEGDGHDGHRDASPGGHLSERLVDRGECSCLR